MTAVIPVRSFDGTKMEMAPALTKDLHKKDNHDSHRRRQSITLERKRKRVLGSYHDSVKHVLQNIYTQLVLGIFIFVTLYLPDLWILTDVPESADSVLDSLLIVILTCFCIEFVTLCLVEDNYICGFFFWMDLLGTASILMDLSYISPHLQTDNTSSASILRAARAAKIGARSGRLTKLLRLIFIKESGNQEELRRRPARSLSQKLVGILSRRVAAIVILCIVCASYLTYSPLDKSIEAYLTSFDEIKSTCTGGCWEDLLDEFQAFYADDKKHPLDLNLSDIQQYTFASDEGIRTDNIATFWHEDSSVRFNLEKQNQWKALLDIILVTIILIILVASGASFNAALDNLVVVPLERMMSTIHDGASALLKSFKNLDLEEEDGGHDDVDEILETDLLEVMLEKIARIIKHTIPDGKNDTELNKVDKPIRQWITNDFMQQNSVTTSATHFSRNVGPNDYVNLRREETTSLETFHMCMLEYPAEKLIQFAKYILVSFDCASEFKLTPQKLDNFFMSIRDGYLDTPYHNFAHAIDVYQTVYVYLIRVKGAVLFSRLDIYSILIAAVAHDIGHPGLNNGFLVKSRHDLAMLHNDVSPLENMHCAKLYDILANDHCDIFSSLGDADWRAVRKIILTCILGTDASFHFSQINKLHVFYEVHGEDIIRDLDIDEKPEILQDLDAKLLLLETILHAADISNPVKIMHVYDKWVEKLVDEFFLQGDIERRNGIEISPMCDRHTVNVPTMQINFIEFFVSPLYLAIFDLFPQMDQPVRNMLQNYREWCDRRLQELSTTTAAPTATVEGQSSKREALIQKRLDFCSKVNSTLER